jgi:hypothetical protein
MISCYATCQLWRTSNQASHDRTCCGWRRHCACVAGCVLAGAVACQAVLKANKHTVRSYLLASLSATAPVLQSSTQSLSDIYSTAEHSTPQHSTAQHVSAQHVSALSLASQTCNKDDGLAGNAKLRSLCAVRKCQSRFGKLLHTHNASGLAGNAKLRQTGATQRLMAPNKPASGSLLHLSLTTQDSTFGCGR